MYHSSTADGEDIASDDRQPLVNHSHHSRPPSPSYSNLPSLESLNAQNTPAVEHQDVDHDDSGANPPTERHQDEEEQEETEEARMAALDAMHWFKRPSPLWMIPFMISVGFYLGLIGGPMGQLMTRVVCKEMLGDDASPEAGTLLAQVMAAGAAKLEDKCKTPAVNAAAALLISRSDSLTAVVAVFTVGYWTSLSDRYGRKVLLQVTMGPAFASNLAMSVIMPSSWNPFGSKLLYPVAIVSGISGGGALVNTAMATYLADCTSQAMRSVAFSWLMMGFACGMIIGPMAGALVIERTNDLLSAFHLGTALLGFAWICVWIMPESLPAYRRQAAARLNASSSSSSTATGVQNDKHRSFMTRLQDWLFSIFGPVLMFIPGRVEAVGDVVKMPSRYMLVLLALVGNISIFSIAGLAAMFVSFTNVVFKWDTTEDGYYFTLQGAGAVIVYSIIFPGLRKIYDKFTVIKMEPDSTDYEPLVNQEDETTIGEASSTFHDQALEEERVAAVQAAKKAAKLKLDGAIADLFFAVLGVTCLCIGHGTVGLVHTERSIFIGLTFTSLSQMFMPSFTSFMTAFIPPHQTGKVLGGLAVMEALSNAVATLTYGKIFSLTSATIPWAIYLISASLDLVNVFILLTVFFMFKASKSAIAAAKAKGVGKPLFGRQ